MLLDIPSPSLFHKKTYKLILNDLVLLFFGIKPFFNRLYLFEYYYYESNVRHATFKESRKASVLSSDVGLHNYVSNYNVMTGKELVN